MAQWWSIALPRRGSRVRIPSRALNDTKKRHPMDVFFLYVRALPGSNGSKSWFHSGRRNRTSPDVLRLKKEISDGYLFFCIFKPGRAERFESLCPTSRLLHSRYECLFSIIKERLCADVAELAPINGVWLKCLSLGEQIRAYEKMFKKYSEFVAYML